MRKETTGGAKKKKKKDLRFTTQSSPDSELQFLQGFQRNRNISQPLYSQKIRYATVGGGSIVRIIVRSISKSNLLNYSRRQKKSCRERKKKWSVRSADAKLQTKIRDCSWWL